ESVDEPEDKNNHKPPMAVVAADEIFEGDEDNARGDDGFDYPRGELDPSGGSQPESEGMGQGEGGDLKEERFPFPAHQEKPENKEDVVETEGEEVEETAFHLRPENRGEVARASGDADRF